jgi:hypothetical protein
MAREATADVRTVVRRAAMAAAEAAEAAQRASRAAAEAAAVIEGQPPRRPRGRRRRPAFSWAGALRDLRGEYSSVQLQHEISKARAKGR